MSRFKFKRLFCALCSTLLLVACSPPLQSAVFRGDLQHTGLYATNPLTKFHAVKWIFKATGRYIPRLSWPTGWSILAATMARCTLSTRTTASWNGSTRPPRKSPRPPRSIKVCSISLTGMGNLYALNALDGSKKWTFATGSEGDWDLWDLFQSSPAVANGKVYFGSGDGYVYAVDALSGKLAWRYNTLEDNQAVRRLSRCILLRRWWTAWSTWAVSAAIFMPWMRSTESWNGNMLPAGRCNPHRWWRAAGLLWRAGCGFARHGC